MQEPDEDNDMIKELEEFHSFCKGLRKLYACGILYSKGIKVKQQILRSILSTMKGNVPLYMRQMQRHEHLNSSPRIFSCLKSIHKFIKHKFVVSGMIDSCSRKFIWLEYSSNNRAQTTRGYFLRAVRDHATPL